MSLPTWSRYKVEGGRYTEKETMSSFRSTRRTGWFCLRMIREFAALSFSPRPQPRVPDSHTSHPGAAGTIKLARAPRKRREVAVDLTGGVVPVDSERVHVAPGRLGEGEAACGGVTDVVEVDRLGRAGAGNALHRDVEHAGNGHGPPHPLPFDPDRLGFCSGELAHQRPDRGHGAPTLPAPDRHEGVALLGGGPLVHAHATGPVARDP